MEIIQHKHKEVYKAVFILGRWRSGNDYVAMVTSKPLTKCVVLAAHQPYSISDLVDFAWMFHILLFYITLCRSTLWRHKSLFG